MKIYIIVENLPTANLGMSQLVSNAFVTKELAQKTLKSWRRISPHYRAKELVIWELDVISKRRSDKE